MTITLDFYKGGENFDWRVFLAQALNAGAYDEIDGTYTDIHLVSGVITVLLTGVDLEISSNALLAGDITSIVMTVDPDTVFDATFETPVPAAGFQTLVGQNLSQDDLMLGVLALFGNEPVVANGSADYDRLYGGSAGDTLNGNDADDELYGDDGDDELNGGNGFDWLVGGAGNDTLNGGGDFDEVHYHMEQGGGPVTVNLATGEATDTYGDHDVLTGIEGVTGSHSASGDTIIGDDNNNFFVGFEGGDTIDGAGGWDTISYRDESGAQGIFVNLSDQNSDDINGWNQGGVAAGTAIDTYGDIDTLNSIEGVIGTSHDDVIIGSDQDNYLEGGEGDDYIVGGKGSDLIMGGAGSDRLRGDNEDGSGQEADENDDSDDDRYFDMLSYENEHQENGVGDGFGVTINIEAGYATIGNDTDWFGGFEGFRGTLNADTFNGSIWDNHFEGLAGDDTFNGGGGEDRVDYGSDRWHGGENGVTVDLGAADENGHYQGTATDGFGDHDNLIDISHIGGTDFGDTITGNDLNNRLEGRDGNDSLVGGGGRDTLDGGSGNDTLEGGSGRDELYGGDGDDSISGGSGDDNIDGGRGNDAIDAGSGDDQIRAGSGGDTVDGGSGYDVLRYDNYNPGEEGFEATGISVTLDDTGAGSGTIAGFFGRDEADDPGAINTSFSNIERIIGTHGSDTFTATDANFVGTIESDRTFGGNAWRDKTVISFVGGGGADTFNVTSGAIIDYGEEVWSHNDFNGDNNNHWGDQGQFGVVINLSADTKNVTQTQHHRENENDGGAELDDTETRSFAIVAGYAADTYSGDGSDDTLFDQIIAGNAFRLTDADDIIWASDIGTFVNARWGNDTFYGGDGNDQFNGDRGNDYAEGGGGDDELNGDDGDDELHGGDGHDNLSGSQGNDKLYGDAGNDNLNGDDGDDTLDGGTGNDNLEGGQGNDSLYGGDGQDELRGGDGNDRLYGEAGNDNLEGGQGNDLLDGGSGDDQLRGGDGNDTLLGGIGDDRLEGHEGNDSLNGGDGDDRLWGDDGNDTLVGGQGDDEIEGGWGGGNDVISGDDDISMSGSTITNLAALKAGATPGGSDQIWAGDGNDLVFGGGGHDQIDGDDGKDTLYGGTGNDSLRGGSGNDSLYGGLGQDRLRGDDGDDGLFGEAGDDQLDGRSGNDTLDGGDGNDKLDGGDGNDSLVGGKGDDGLNGGSGNDKLEGGDGSDKLDGGSGNDSLVGGAGIDWLNGGSGNDTLVADADDRLYGDDGNDTYVLGAIASNQFHGDMWENSNGGTDTIQTSIDRDLTFSQDGDGFHFQNIENAIVIGAATGTQVNLTGNDLANVLTGHAGKNSLSGGNGNDTLDGGAGDDTLLGGNNNDSLLGGAGKDKLDGGSGVDTLDGGADNDSLLGGSGNDKLLGGTGNDTLDGGTNNDTLTGGAGRDMLTGGANNDYFVFLATGDSGTSATTRDIITDFVHGTDRIDLSAIDADTTKSGDQKFVLDAKGSAGTAVAKGHIGWYQENPSGTANDKTILKINVDGDSTIEMTIELKGLVSLTSGDFIL